MLEAYSAQVAKLIALTRACILTKAQTSIMSTDCKYAFEVCHAVGTIQKSRGFLISAATPIANGHIIAALLQAIHLLSEMSVVHCSAHTKKTDTMTLGRNRADRTVKYAAQNGPLYPFSTHFLNLL